MVKQVWVWIALVAGLVLGVFLTTYGAYVLGFSTAESSVRSARATETRESAVDEARMAPTPTPTAGRAGEVRPGFSPPPVTLPAAGPAQTATAPPASVSMVIENAEPEHVDYTNYSGYSLPVDAGPHFGPQIADSIRTGRRDSLTEEHLQLEREVRDDSWSYPLEAELQNMLAADPVMGRFKVEHVECRATLCEVRVHGKVQVQQAPAVNQWLSSMQRMAWPGGLRAGTAIFSSSDDGMEGMLMLRKQPPLPSEATPR